MSVASEVSPDGRFERSATQFRRMIVGGGGGGGGGSGSELVASSGRYHLYVSYACPWAGRVLAVRALKGLCAAISVSVVDWHMADGSGWVFSPHRAHCTPDHVHHFTSMRQVYQHHHHQQHPHQPYTGRVTVPVLYDKQTKQIVNNESSEIIRMLNSEFNEFCSTDEERQLDLYPEDLRERIDEVNSWVYDQINNGVYKCGFARSQQSYDEAFDALFAGLDRAERLLSQSRYLCGDRFTEADIRLFVTLIRFDPVYVGHFKCNLRRIVDYPNLFGFTRELYQNKKIRETVNMEHIKRHYMESHLHINPFGIVSKGPDLQAYEEPHDRNRVYGPPANNSKN